MRKRIYIIIAGKLISLLLALQLIAAPVTGFAYTQLRPMAAQEMAHSAAQGLAEALRSSSSGDLPPKLTPEWEGSQAERYEITVDCSAPRPFGLAELARYEEQSISMIARPIDPAQINEERTRLQTLVQKIQEKTSTPQQRQILRRVAENIDRTYREQWDAFQRDGRISRPAVNSSFMLERWLELEGVKAQLAHYSEGQVAVRDLFEILEEESPVYMPLVDESEKEMLRQEAQGSGAPLATQQLQKETEHRVKDLIEARARNEWESFCVIADEMLAEGKERMEAFHRALRDLERNRAIAQEELNIVQQELSEGKSMRSGEALTEEKRADRRKRIEELRARLAAIEKDLHEGRSKRAFTLGLEVAVPGELKRDKLRDHRPLAEQNVTVAGFLYNLRRANILTAQNSPDPHDPLSEALYLTGKAYQRIAARVHKAEPFFLKAEATEKGLAIYTEETIDADSFRTLQERFNIKAVISTIGTVTSHWIIEIAQMGVPVFILKHRETDGQEEKVTQLTEDEAPTGTEVIFAPARPGANAVLIFNPAAFDKKRALYDMQKQTYENGFYLSQTVSDRQAPAEGRVAVGGNVVFPQDVRNVVGKGAEYIGITRTELALSDTELLEPLIELIDVLGKDHATPQGKNSLEKRIKRDAFIAAHRKYFKGLIAEERGMTGPVLTRTFDFQWDKNRTILESLPPDQRKTGFDFYRTRIGKTIMILQMASLIAQAYEMRAEYSFNPTITIPMISSAEDLRWVAGPMLHAAMALATTIVLTDTHPKAHERPLKETREIYRKQRPEIAGFVRERMRMGPMIELTSALEHYGEILEAARQSRLIIIDTMSIGTNDLISELMTALFKDLMRPQVEAGIMNEQTWQAIRVARDDKYSAGYFIELRPELLNGLVTAIAGPTQRYNAQAEDARHRIKISFCGELACRPEALLFAKHLAKGFGLQAGVSMPSNDIPQIKFYRKFMQQQQQSRGYAPWEIFAREFHPETGTFPREIGTIAQGIIADLHAQVRQTRDYREAVTDLLAEYPQEQLAPPASRAGSAVIQAVRQAISISA